MSLSHAGAYADRMVVASHAMPVKPTPAKREEESLPARATQSDVEEFPTETEGPEMISAEDCLRKGKDHALQDLSYDFSDVMGDADCDSIDKALDKIRYLRAEHEKTLEDLEQRYRQASQNSMFVLPPDLTLEEVPLPFAAPPLHSSTEPEFTKPNHPLNQGDEIDLTTKEYLDYRKNLFSWNRHSASFERSKEGEGKEVDDEKALEHLSELNERKFFDKSVKDYIQDRERDSEANEEYLEDAVEELQRRVDALPEPEEMDEEVEQEVRRRMNKRRPGSAPPARKRVSKAEPFTFLEREKRKSETQNSISSRRFREYISEVRRKEEEELAKKFRALPAPSSSLVPMYDKMNKEMERARLINKEKRGRAMAKPFSFQSKDEAFLERKEKKLEESRKKESEKLNYTFEAKSVNRKIFESKAEEFERRKREAKEEAARRAEELLQRSSLPPRMEMWKDKGPKVIQMEKPKPFRATPIPPFRELQNQFEGKLSKLKATKKPVEPKPFAFVARDPSMGQSAKKQKRQQALREWQEDLDRLGEMRWPYFKRRFPKARDYCEKPDKPPAPLKAVPGTTETERLRHVSYQERMLELQKRKEMEEIEERERLMRKRAFGRKLKPFLAQVEGTTQRKRELLLQKHRKEWNRRTREYELRLKQIEERVSALPYTFQRGYPAQAGKKALKMANRAIEAAGLEADDYMRMDSDA